MLLKVRFPLRLRILGHMVIGLKQVRVSSGNLVLSASTKFLLLSLSDRQTKMTTRELEKTGRRKN